MTMPSGVFRLPLARLGGLLWFTWAHAAQTDFGAASLTLTLTLPHLIVPAATQTVVVPIGLHNELAEVGGIQLDIAHPGGELALVDAQPTVRAPGWVLQQIPLADSVTTRLLLFDPLGANILPGVGPVMNLTFALPMPGEGSTTIPLVIRRVVISSPGGAQLPATARDGSLAIGYAAGLAVGSVTANHGDTVRLGISLVNQTPLGGVEFKVTWPLNVMELGEVVTTFRSTSLQLSWAEAADGSVAIRLYSEGGAAIGAGQGDILELVLTLAAPLPATVIEVGLEELRLLPVGVMAGATGEQTRGAFTSSPGQVSVFPGQLDGPHDLVGWAGPAAQVSLSWRHVASSAGAALPLDSYVVYRSPDTPVPQGPATHIATLGRDTATQNRLPSGFLDTTAAAGMTYHYVVTARYEGGIESSPSHEVSVTPITRMELTVGVAKLGLETPGMLPISLSNEADVAGVRFELKGLPDQALTVSRAILGQRIPPDWVVSLQRDSVRQVWIVRALSPNLTTIPPGTGEIFSLRLEPRSITFEPASIVAGAVVIAAADGRAYASSVVHGSVTMETDWAQLKFDPGTPAQPGDTGYVTLVLDNPQPVMAFQGVVTPGAPGLELLNVTGEAHLPEDTQVNYRQLGNGAVRVTVSSFSNTPIPMGAGPVITLVYRVAPDTPEGTIGLDLSQVVYADVDGLTWSQGVASSGFPVGEVRAVFTLRAAEGEPGRAVTIPVDLVNATGLCEFEILIEFDPQYLSLLGLQTQDRMPYPEELGYEIIQPGTVMLTYTAANASGVLAPGSGPVFALAFGLNVQTPGDTSLALILGPVTAWSCAEIQVFAAGHDALLHVAPGEKIPTHFAVSLAPTGVTHIIQLNAATLGGFYLDEGDELAVMDSAGWINSQGDIGQVIAGVGIVQPDGSIHITATLGLDRGDQGPLLPGARPGNNLIFLAWDRQSNVEGKSGRDGRYVLGSGVWGENSGLTIMEIVRLPGEGIPMAGRIPKELIVDPPSQDPFGTQAVIRFGLPLEMTIQVRVFDLLGRELITLHDGLTSAGFHELAWDGVDAKGATVANGMIFFQVQTPDQTVTHKMLLMR